MASKPLAFFLIILLTSIVAADYSEYTEHRGLTCKDHPAYQSSFKPPLIRSWYLYFSGPQALQPVYLPRFKNLTYVPADDTSSTKYEGLDLFYFEPQPTLPSFRMYFQRKAKIHMVVPVSRRPSSVPTISASLPGWRSEGWVRIKPGSSTLLTYGIHQRVKIPLQHYAYMFSRSSSLERGDHYVDLPMNAYIKEKLKSLTSAGLPVDGGFHLLISEKNGAPSNKPGKFKGKTIKPNTECPAVLHDVWTAVEKDDPTLRGTKFQTWHPNWDPCFWCAYDHDHGSSPKHIFGFEPKYYYVAHKNSMEAESHKGFKGFVFRNKGFYVYYSVHVQTSRIRRLTARNHTVQLVIKEAATDEIVVNIAHKGDFGWQSVREQGNNKFRPLTAKDRAIQRMQESSGVATKFRSIPVLDSSGGTFKLRSPPIVGQYEEWQTLPICTINADRRKPNNAFRSTFKEPLVGIESFTDHTERNLGRCINRFKARSAPCTESDPSFIYSPGLPRALFIFGVKVASSECPNGKSGVFYTDPFAEQTFNTPGANRLRQYIKPGFETMIHGRFEVVEPWVGLHGFYGRGFFHDHGYGINPFEN